MSTDDKLNDLIAERDQLLSDIKPIQDKEKELEDEVKRVRDEYEKKS